MELKGLMGGFYRLSEWITRMAAINLLWIGCSAPFFFLILTKVLLLGQHKYEEAQSLNYLLAIVAPFTIFPATSAMFCVIRKWVMGEEDVKLLVFFLKSWKQNFKQSLYSGLVYTSLIFLIWLDFEVYTQQMNSLEMVGFFLLGCGFVLVSSLFNLFSLISHVHLSTRVLLKNTLLLTFFRPVPILLNTLYAGIVIYLCYHLPALALFFGGSILAYTSFAQFYVSFNKLKNGFQK